MIALNDPELVALGRWWYVFDLMEAGRIEEAREQHEALANLADELRQPLFRHFAAVWDVVWAQMADRPADIERLAERAHALGVAAAAPDAGMIRLAQLMALRLQQGRLPEYLQAVEPLAAEQEHLPAWRAALAVGLLVSGQRERGEALYGTLDEHAIPRDMTWLTTQTLLSWCATLLGDTARAGRLYALLLPYRERTVQDVLAANWGSVERYLGSLAMVRGEYTRAEEHFEAALARNAHNAQALRLTRMEYAQLLLATDQPARARALLAVALDDAQAAGLTAVADFIRVQLSPRAPSDSPSSSRMVVTSTNPSSASVSG